MKASWTRLCAITPPIGMVPLLIPFAVVMMVAVHACRLKFAMKEGRDRLIGVALHA